MKQITVIALGLLFTSGIHANELMNADQFVDYSARQHCINQQFWDQPEKQDSELMALEKEMGITDDNFDAVDALMMQYQQQSDLQAKVEAKVNTLCPES